VIRELGYPGRGTLWMWYKDRLEEDHYLEYGRRLSRTMRIPDYPKSRENCSWPVQLASGRRKLRHGPVPEELKCVCSIEVRPMQRNYSVRKSGRN